MSIPSYGPLSDVKATLPQPEAEDQYIEPNDDDKTITDNEWLERARGSWLSSEAYFNANIRLDLTNNVRQFNSKHAPDHKYNTLAYKYKSKLFKPKTRSIIRNHEAVAASAFFSSLDVVNVEAQDQDDQLQTDSAKLYKELLNHRLYRDIPWFKTCMAAYQNAMVYGISISKQTWDFNKNIPSIQLISPENFRFDVSSDWIDPVNSSPYIIEMIPMYVYEVKRKIKQDGWFDVSDEELMSARKQRFDSIRKERENHRLDPKDRSNIIPGYELVWVHLNIMAKDDGSGDVAFYTLGTETLLTPVVNLEEMFLNGERPFVIGSCVIEAHRNYGAGLCELTKELQKEENEIINQRIDNVKIAMDKRYFIKKGQQVDIQSIKYNSPGGVTFLNDPEKDVKIIQTNDVTSNSYQEINLLNQDFDAICGGFDAATVQANRSLNETVGGMQMLSSHANQVTEYQIKTFVETWMIKVLYQLTHLEQKYENDRTMLGIAGKKAGLMQRYENEDALHYYLMEHDLTLKISVGMGAVNPTNQIEKFMMAITNLAKIFPNTPQKLNFSEVCKEVFGKVGYEDGTRFVIQDDGTNPQISELESQIQELQQQLTQKKPQEAWQAEVALKKAQTVKTYTEAAFGAMQAGEVVAQMPAVAQVADVVMSSSGFIPQAGQDPNYPTPSVGPATLKLAKEQSDYHFFKKNTDPLDPATGQAGFNKGIKSGDNT